MPCLDRGIFVRPEAGSKVEGPKTSRVLVTVVVLRKRPGPQKHCHQRALWVCCWESWVPSPPANKRRPFIGAKVRTAVRQVTIFKNFTTWLPPGCRTKLERKVGSGGMAVLPTPAIPRTNTSLVSLDYWFGKLFLCRPGSSTVSAPKSPSLSTTPTPASYALMELAHRSILHKTRRIANRKWSLLAGVHEYSLLSPGSKPSWTVDPAGNSPSGLTVRVPRAGFQQ